MKPGLSSEVSAPWHFLYIKKNKLLFFKVLEQRQLELFFKTISLLPQHIGRLLLQPSAPVTCDDLRLVSWTSTTTVLIHMDSLSILLADGWHPRWAWKRHMGTSDSEVSSACVPEWLCGSEAPHQTETTTLDLYVRETDHILSQRNLGTSGIWDNS